MGKLNAMREFVTQECGTEPAFNNEYWDNKREGIYVDVVTGEVLFISKDKFDSGTGWPSFRKAVGKVTEKVDYSLGMKRIEVRGKESHLGHVFNEGKKRRYCINSAALRFIPKEDIGKEGYNGWAKEFE